MAQDRNPNRSFAWEAPEYQYYHKDAGWYWLSILIATIIVLISLWERNFLFAFFVIVAELMIISWGSKYPRTVRFEINEKGVVVDGKTTYRFSDIDRFSINEEGELSELILYFKTRLSTALQIHFQTENIRRIRGLLREKISEIHHDESLTDSLAKLIRF
jgi:hypothetical protein